ncbi:hypothetical protein L5515_009785 [Caenorhabditis briggsae]|nr:hypothetical protein L3Y34_009982 [Caenorhabditis briggsae]UMM38328.1 hypothetical protein L5515_009785 [Caenorhabditis briggsae]
MIQYYEIIVKPFLDLKLSETEITFILCQIVWNYAGRRLQGQTQAAGERFLEEISNNLHSYYEENSGDHQFGGIESSGNGTVAEKNDKGNYASRLAKMMQIVNQMLNIQLKREDTMDIAMLFDMFNIVFTEPEFFKV